MSAHLFARSLGWSQLGSSFILVTVTDLGVSDRVTNHPCFPRAFLVLAPEILHSRTSLSPKQIRIIGYSKDDLGGCSNQTGRILFYTYFLSLLPSLWTQTRKPDILTSIGSHLPTTKEASWGQHTAEGRARCKQQNRVTNLVLCQDPSLCAVKKKKRSLLFIPQ